MSVPISRIYISYRRTDTAAYAGRLFDHLSRHFGRGFVFMDIQGGIARGQDFTQAINAALDTCDVALVLIGKHWATSTGPNDNLRLEDPSDWVRVETAAALRRNILVIPVLVDGARLPDPANLPEELRPLCMRHVCELTDPRWSYDVGELVKDIEKIAPRPQPKIFTWLLGQLSLYLNELKLLYLRNKSLHWKTGAVLALAVLLGIGLGLSLGKKESNTISLPSRPAGFAKEPNDGIYDATAILFGSSMKSKLTKHDPIDWYVFKTPDDVGEEFLIIYRNIDGDAKIVIEVYDPNEKKIFGDASFGEIKSFKIKGEKNVIYYIKVQATVYYSGADTVNYELAIRNKSADAAGSQWSTRPLLTRLNSKPWWLS
jgi:TIR domain